jgi:glycosyltransferase involved in cell wall biosynthesis
MDVVIVSHEFPPIAGGAGIALRGFLRAAPKYCDEYGVTLRVVFPCDVDSPMGSVPVCDAIIMHPVAAGKTASHDGRWTASLRWLHKARRLIKQLPCDVMHVWGAMPNVYLARRPFILTLHGSDVPGRNPDRDRLFQIIGRGYRRRWRRAAAITAVTEGMGILAAKFCQRPVEVVPNGVEVPSIGVWRQPHCRVQLLWVGRLIALRNVHMALQVAGLLQKQVELIIVGDGKERDIVEQCPLRNVFFCGWQADPTEFYRYSDILLNTGNVTGMTLAMKEAMAHGLPVVSTPFLDCDNIPGLTSCKANAVDMARAVDTVMHDYAAAALLARKTGEGFAWDGPARQYFDLYRSIYDERNNRTRCR